jgi:hypothetical protein
MEQTAAPGAESTETTKSVAFIIEFEDHGQDFLRWHLAADGEVLLCAPCQNNIWAGAKVQNPEGLGVGDIVSIDLFGIFDDPVQVLYPLSDFWAVPQ